LHHVDYSLDNITFWAIMSRATVHARNRIERPKPEGRSGSARCIFEPHRTITKNWPPGRSSGGLGPCPRRRAALRTKPECCTKQRINGNVMVLSRFGFRASFRRKLGRRSRSRTGAGRSDSGFCTSDRRRLQAIKDSDWRPAYGTSSRVNQRRRASVFVQTHQVIENTGEVFGIGQSNPNFGHRRPWRRPW